MVRAAQGRDDEAEALLSESIGILERSDYTRFLTEPLKAIIQFLEERERFPEAVAFEQRLAELRVGALPEESAARIA
jgi:hypothetical protein